MKKPRTALAMLTALACVLSTTPASAQYHRDDRNDRHDRNDRRDNDRNDRHDRNDRRSERYHWRYYGGHYGYEGYAGRWREGHRFPYYRDRRYVIDDYWDYDLPPPWPGYRYYRDRNGDIVMAAIASGIIGLIIGNALADHR
jgi:Ni/Co efflux regulator RcnB